MHGVQLKFGQCAIDAFIKNELEGLLTAFADVGQNLLEAAGCPVPDEPSPAAESGDE